MARSVALVFVLSFVVACASGGGARAAPISWPPGTYYLEADIEAALYETYSADLYIDAGGSMRLDNHRGGPCQRPTPPELRRDAQRRVRTFRCGNAVYVIRPGQTTVTGELIARVEETYMTEQCVRTSAGGACQQTVLVERTRTVNRRARLRVVDGR